LSEENTNINVTSTGVLI